MNKTQSFVDIFFNYADASNWIERHLFDFYEDDNWEIKELEIKLMDSGAYRAGVVFDLKQPDLFGSCEDA